MAEANHGESSDPSTPRTLPPPQLRRGSSVPRFLIDYIGCKNSRDQILYAAASNFNFQYSVESAIKSEVECKVEPNVEFKVGMQAQIKGHIQGRMQSRIQG